MKCVTVKKITAVMFVILGIILSTAACNSGNDARDMALKEMFPVEAKELQWGAPPEEAIRNLGDPEETLSEYNTTVLSYKNIKTVFGTANMELVFSDDELPVGEKNTGKLGLVKIRIRKEDADIDQIAGQAEKLYGPLEKGSNEMLDQIASGITADGSSAQVVVLYRKNQLTGELFTEEKLEEIMTQYSAWSRRPMEVLQKQPVLSMTVVKFDEGGVEMEFNALDLVVLEKAGLL